jgi:hypothetical protein
LDLSIAIPGQRIWMALGFADQAHQGGRSGNQESSPQGQGPWREGAVIFLEKASGALEHVDSSSGAIGTAVIRAIETLVPIVAQAPASDNLRDKWLERLWCAIDDDNLHRVAPRSLGRIMRHARERLAVGGSLYRVVRLIWSPDLPRGGHFKGTAACLSALHAAGRHEELLNLFGPVALQILA